MGLENDEPTGNYQDIDADALLGEIEGGGNRDVPMHQPTPTEGAAPTPQQQTPAMREIEFTWNGKPIKAPIDKATQWAQQGYDYAQRMAAFNQERTAWEGQRKQFEESYSPYKTIDEYAKQNPEWWKHVESSFQARTLSGTQDPSTPPVPKEILDKLSNFEKFKSDFEAKEAAKAREAEDTKLTQEVQSIRDTYKDLDWDSPDERGQTLEQRVIKHAMDNGIKNFRAAFRDYNHEQLVKIAEERGKETQTKELQKRTKLGLLGQTPTPKKGVTKAEGVKNKSYEDLFREALEEEGIA